jgi:hypothetical protein
VILYRCFAWNARARENQQDGPLWFPQIFQGDGRHDNPDLYGCLYVADRAISSVVEQLARFRSQRLQPALLRRRGLPLAVAELQLGDDLPLINLDDPAVLRRERLRPSVVATRRRDITQPQARKLYQEHPEAAGLLWWSTYEALWTNVTLFDRSVPRLRVQSVRELSIDDAIVIDAAHFFEMRIT